MEAVKASEGAAEARNALEESMSAVDSDSDIATVLSIRYCRSR
jgi:hypothetical protein